jgi:hypothetical protein
MAAETPEEEPLGQFEHETQRRWLQPEKHQQETGSALALNHYPFEDAAASKPFVC